MGLLETEIKELRQMNKMVMNGSMKPEEVNARIAIYSQVEKRAKLMVQAYALGAKFGATHTNKLIKHQLIGKESMIDLSDTENELIHCPDQDKTITRKECEEYSSTTGNLTSCSSCNNFKTTRKLLNIENTEG
jgi:hypothetical protein